MIAMRPGDSKPGQGEQNDQKNQHSGGASAAVKPQISALSAPLAEGPEGAKAACDGQNQGQVLREAGLATFDQRGDGQQGVKRKGEGDLGGDELACK